MAPVLTSVESSHGS